MPQQKCLTIFLQWNHVTSSLFETVKELEGETESSTDKYNTYKAALKGL